MRYMLLHTSAWDPASVGPTLERAQIETRQARLPRDLSVDERPSVFVLDSESRSVFPLDVLRAFVDAGGAIVALGRNGEADLPAEMPAELLSGFVRQPVGPRQLLVAVRAGYRGAAASPPPTPAASTSSKRAIRDRSACVSAWRRPIPSPRRRSSSSPFPSTARASRATPR